MLCVRVCVSLKQPFPLINCFFPSIIYVLLISLSLSLSLMTNSPMLLFSFQPLPLPIPLPVLSPQWSALRMPSAVWSAPQVFRRPSMRWWPSSPRAGVSSGLPGPKTSSGSTARRLLKRTPSVWESWCARLSNSSVVENCRTERRLNGEFVRSHDLSQKLFEKFRAKSSMGKRLIVLVYCVFPASLVGFQHTESRRA